MPWLLTAVVLIGTCWFIAALASQPAEGAEPQELGKLAARAWEGLGKVLRAVASAILRGLAAGGRTAARSWRQTRSDVAAFVRSRRDQRADRRARDRAPKTHRPRFERSFILTRPDELEEEEEDVVPLTAMSRTRSGASRLVAFVEIVFLVVVWGSGAALAIAGAVWAVTRMV